MLAPPSFRSMRGLPSCMDLITSAPSIFSNHAAVASGFGLRICTWSQTYLAMIFFSSCRRDLTVLRRAAPAFRGCGLTLLSSGLWSAMPPYFCSPVQARGEWNRRGVPAMRASRFRATVCVFATALFVFSSCCGIAQGAAPAPARAQWDENPIDLAKLFDAVVDTIDSKSFDEALLKQLDWRARAREVRPSIISAATTEDAVGRINALLAELKTSHTGLFTPDDYEYYILLDIVGTGTPDLLSRRFWGMGPYYPGIGAFTRKIDGRHFVDGILEGSPADQAGLKYGDEIFSVDGVPYTPIAAFRDKLGRKVKLDIHRGANAAAQRVEVRVTAINPKLAFTAATQASTRVVERNGNRIGYVHIWAFHDRDTLRTAFRAFEQPGSSATRRFSTKGKEAGAVPRR